MKLLAVEVRRALHRRIVWVLLAVAFAGAALAGVVAFVSSAGRDPATLVPAGSEEGHPALMVDWWKPGTANGLLTIAAFFLLMGALIGGASVVGAEWRAGTVTTVLTWEPRRLRLFGARVGACVLCAGLIAVVLQVLFLAAFLPAVLANGSTAGADAEWVRSLAGAVGRIAVLTALAAGLGASLAFLGRNTTAALAVGWGWVVVGESLVRSLRPGSARFLVGENGAVFLTGADLEGASFTRAPVVAAATLLGYAGLVAVLAAVRFRRADIAAT